jgi:uncharacterized protein (DUF1800 family)
MKTVSALLLALTFATAAPSTGAPSTGRWDARAAEHLLNRAGFGARPAEIEQALELGREALVERLLTQRADVEPPFFERIIELTPREREALSEEGRKQAKTQYREKERRQPIEYAAWWLRRMQSGEDPLLERMTLFWHGFFTTSIEDVKRSYLVLQQNQFLREHALGSYAELLRGIAKDPAMLVYLDNNNNRQGNPNENFARELMELYSLGVGNYSEDDVKNAARALTGRGTNLRGDYEFRRKQHDAGEKTILGVQGALDGDRLVEILLAQPACARWVAKKLITYFEGVEPSPERLEEYARFLRQGDYAIQPFLRKLFLDPAFYRDEIVGARVLGPIEFMVSTARRAGIEAPPLVLGAGATLLGQRMFAPPSVKGWEEGPAWITTSTMMQRGNLAGLMLGVIKIDDVLSQADLAAPMMSEPSEMDADGASMESMTAQTPAARTAEAGKKPAAKVGKGGAAYQALRLVQQTGWTPEINLCARLARAGAKTDAEIVERMLDELLAIQAPADTQARMLAFLSAGRKELGVSEGALLELGGNAERLLRRLAHLILSMPEAQLG